MARVVDADVKASIMASDPQAAYNDIVEALNLDTSDFLGIELLPRTHSLPPGCNVLVHGTSIGVPKLKLVQAFVVARQVFSNCLEDFKKDKFQDIRNATVVILLMDPEHITAANARKRIIKCLRKGSETDYQSVLRRELLVTDGFLTSWLHRHNKSPNLWGHRRWLLQELNSLNVPHDIEWDIEAVIFIAAERHPRNYYGWLHLRWLLRTFHNKGASLGGPDAFHQQKSLGVVKDWCLKHPSDTSGWSFLLFYLLTTNSSKSFRIERNSSICGEVLDLAISFKWTHETIWAFLRTLVATGEIMEDQRSSFFNTIQAVMADQPEDSKAWKMLQTSSDWCVEYSV
jgi:hypothetical protein